MKKVGIVITLAIILFCMGMKFNSVAMNRVSGNDVMTSSGLGAADRASLNDQIKQLDAQIAEKEQELEKAGRFEEYAVKKELNALRKKRADTASMFTLDVVLAQPELREAMPVKKCQLSQQFIKYLYTKTAKIFENFFDMVWSDDSKKLAGINADANKITILDANSGEQIGQELQLDNRRASSVAWSPDGNKLAIGLNEFNNAMNNWQVTTEIWDLNTNMRVGPIFNHGQTDNTSVFVHELGWSRDGTKLMMIYRSGIELWDLSTVTQVSAGHLGKPLAMSANKTDWVKVAFDDNGMIKIWNFRTFNGVLPRPISLCPTDDVNSISFNADGSRLAVIGNDSMVKVWDMSHLEGYLLRPLLISYFKQEGDVSDIDLSPDGKKLAIAFEKDNAVKIFDVSTTAQVGPLLPHNQVEYVLWSPDGSKLVSGNFDDCRIWFFSMVTEFLANLNINQCELLQAFDLAIEQKGRIQATDDQWHTFTRFPKAVKDALRLYIKAPAEEIPMMSKIKREAMEKRIGKKLTKTWAREKREAQQK